MYAYGPVPSRRLGLSSGVSSVPPEICSYNCIYCQLGRTGRVKVHGESCYLKEDILSDIEKEVNSANIDYITFAGDSEPALCKDPGCLIGQCKENWQTPVAVIKNGYLLFKEDVRQDQVDLRKEYSGEIWLEIMLVKGVNSDISLIEIKDAIEQIKLTASTFQFPPDRPNPGELSGHMRFLEKIGKRIRGD